MLGIAPESPASGARFVRLRFLHNQLFTTLVKTLASRNRASNRGGN